MRLFLTLMIFSFISLSCETDTKEEFWNEQQMENYRQRCYAGFQEADPQELDEAKNLCDCMLEEIMEDYTPEEAENITEEEQLQILTDCNYNW
ncbi:MAG: hypothetical protein ACNS62_01370 [Candidatus Cyclobacteriaceae bacterium M3_2C_046]